MDPESVSGMLGVRGEYMSLRGPKQTQRKKQMGISIIGNGP